ncbi:membrane hypothetical protein [Candidatus Zixiibacteriota bacterium]|nr:membrane hypothetical protein [candidate division Zixibacteria bacterium]
MDKSDQSSRTKWSTFMKKRMLSSFVLSAVIVGLLVGNAHMALDVGYPKFLQPAGLALVDISLILAVPAMLVFSLMEPVGLAWELKGRESFIVSNPEAWIFCILLYALIIYGMRFLWSWYRQRKTAPGRHSAP